MRSCLKRQRTNSRQTDDTLLELYCLAVLEARLAYRHLENEGCIINGRLYPMGQHFGEGQQGRRELERPPSSRTKVPRRSA